MARATTSIFPVVVLVFRREHLFFFLAAKWFFDSEVLKICKLLFYSFLLFTFFNGLYIQCNVQCLPKWQGIQHTDILLSDAELQNVGFREWNWWSPYSSSGL